MRFSFRGQSKQIITSYIKISLKVAKNHQKKKKSTLRVAATVCKHVIYDNELDFNCVFIVNFFLCIHPSEFICFNKKKLYVRFACHIR